MGTKRHKKNIQEKKKKIIDGFHIVVFIMFSDYISFAVARLLQNNFQRQANWQGPYNNSVYIDKYSYAQYISHIVGSMSINMVHISLVCICIPFLGAFTLYKTTAFIRFKMCNCHESRQVIDMTYMIECK